MATVAGELLDGPDKPRDAAVRYLYWNWLDVPVASIARAFAIDSGVVSTVAGA